uniref:Uncharacterized protein n=1 Tax=viral metagenome TaxID=1070528 RepID=A0A6C0LHI2_9ZZZZ
MALYIPEDVCTQIESYMNLCESCSRYNISADKVYCDNHCYYMNKKLQLNYVNMMLTLNVFVILYGNNISIIICLLLFIISVEQLF